MEISQELNVQQIISFISVMPSSAGIFEILNNKISLLFANQSFYSLIGRTNDDLLNTENLIYPKDLTLINSFIEKTSQGHRICNNEIRLLTKSNEYLWVNAEIQYIELTDSRKILFVTFSQSSKKDELSYTPLENKNALKAHYLTDKEKHIVWAKDKFLFCSFNFFQNVIEEITTFNGLKISVEKLSSADSTRDFLVKQIFSAEDRKKISILLSGRNIFRKYLSRNLQFSEQCQILVDGVLIWVDVSVMLFSHPQTKELVGSVIITNINERKLNENLLHKIVSIDYDCIVVFQISDDKCKVISSQIETPILSALKKYGYTKGFNYFFENNKIEIDEPVSKFSVSNVVKSLQTERVFIQPLTIKEKNEVKKKRIFFTYTDDSKQYICIVIQDITTLFEEEEKQKELLQGALDKAQKAIDTKNDFLSHISHDIRTPLNAIIGLTNLAKDVNNKPEEVLYFLNKIDVSGQIITGLFDDVIDMSQIENGHFELHPESYHYKDFCSSILRPFETQCKEKHINFVFDKESLLPALMVDRHRFNQIFYNLFSTVIKYAFTGDTISFSVENQKTESNLFIADFIIKESGVGISLTLQKQLENLFKQNTIDGIRQRTGLGLGLVIIKVFVFLLGGKITVKTIPGKGTTFKISLAIPMVQNTIKADTYVEDFSMLSGKKILLVEDNDLNREIACRQLEKKNMKVIQSINGEDALKIFSASEPGTFNAILMDIQMPIMTGYEATKAIRALNRPDALITPIIAMSANGFVEDIKNSLAAGMVAHLTKPIDLNRLYGTLAAFCTS